VSFEIRLITTADAIPLRKKILRPEETNNAGVMYAGDDFSTTYHFGIFVDQKLCGVSTFLSEPIADFPAKLPYRLRGMAVESELQGQGLGFKLLKHGVEFLEQKNCDLIWFNARENAFSFYGKLGFVTHGPLFDIKGAGPHKVMYKRMQPL
jgi:GNAT superfamily N-acetyltransferase